MITLDDRDFDYNADAEQAKRPHAFVRKIRRRANAHDRPRFSTASLMSSYTFGQVLSAAEFADVWEFPLDTLVTIDLSRLGVENPQGAAREVTRFLKAANDFQWNQRLQPMPWIYAIENGLAGLHAHIALYVPGVTPVYTKKSPVRGDFRDWVRGYPKRAFKKDIDRAIYVRCENKESRLRHWINISYILKGYDYNDIVVQKRNAIDGRDLYLADLIAMPFVNPGYCAGIDRIRVSQSLGPKQRLSVGVPVGAEAALPRKPNWGVIDFSSTKPMTTPERMNTRWTVEVPMPFQSRWEAGLRDVRHLYPAEFYRFVTKQLPFAAPKPPERPADELLCQLHAMAERAV